MTAKAVEVELMVKKTVTIVYDPERQKLHDQIALTVDTNAYTLLSERELKNDI